MRYCEKCNKEIDSNIMDCPYCGYHSEIEVNEHLDYSDTVLAEEEVPEELKKKKGIKIFSIIYMSVIYIFLIVIAFILLIQPHLNEWDSNPEKGFLSICIGFGIFIIVILLYLWIKYVINNAKLISLYNKGRIIRNLPIDSHNILNVKTVLHGKKNGTLVEAKYIDNNSKEHIFKGMLPFNADSCDILYNPNNDKMYVMKPKI